MGRLEEEIFVCIDCETTGLDAAKDAVIEVAVVKFCGDKILEQFESLIDPKRPIPEETTKIHHITDQMVQGMPTIDQVIPQVLSIMGNYPIVGHGVQFDIELIAIAADRASKPHTLRKNQVLDTLRMARLYGESPTNSLEKLRTHFNISEEGAHRAMSDVIVNMEVFKQLSKDYKTTEALMKVLSKPIALKCMPLGKHKGRPMKEVPLQYLLWAANKEFDQDLLYTIRSEINRRKKGDSFSHSSNPFSKL